MTQLDFGMSKVKITTDCRGGEGIYVDAGGVKVYLLFLFVLFLAMSGSVP